MLTSYQVSSQIQLSQQAPSPLLLLAEEQFAQHHYRLSSETAKQYMASSKHLGVESPMYMEKANFYYLCAKLKQDDGTVIKDAESFIGHTSNPAYKQRVALCLGQYFFYKSMLAAAVPYYEMAGISNLSNDEIADTKFELAYAYFNLQQFDKAEPLFQAAKEVNGKYELACNYYYGLLAYNRGNYSDAVNCFKRISSDEKYKNIVPYYIAEINYYNGEKDKALSEALRLLGLPEKQYYDNELHLLAAQVYFEQQNYNEALPYFEYYYQHTDRIRKENLYEMAYCYYSKQMWDGAISSFNQLTDNKDSLGQTSLYLIGDCFLNKKDYVSARNAYKLCADMNYNRGQREAALMLAAKLSYKQGYNDDALKSVNTLLAEYPESKYKDEAKTLLSDLLIKTNNYEQAYTYLKDVKVKDALYYQVMQRVMYGYAMLQLQQDNVAGADSLLGMSLQKPSDEKYEMAANYWRGELAYKMKNYEDVISFSEKFISKAGINKTATMVSPEATLHNAYENMGYAAIEKKDFEAAEWYFNKARLSATDTANLNTSLLKQADATYMQKKYVAAIALYDQIIAANKADVDYAKYQKAIALGVLGKRADKIAILQGLMNQEPKSVYANDARYEMALVNIEDDKYAAAITTLEPLTVSYDNSRFIPKSLMKTGFCYQQLNMNDKAFETYKKIVTDFPGAEERSAALDALRSMYIDANKPEGFAQLLKENNIRFADDNGLDSTYYNAAEVQYSSGNWHKSKQAFTEYLTKFPNGVFAVKAHYYKAVSHAQMKETLQALVDYDAVLQSGWSEFAERSALAASVICIRQNDYAKASAYYMQLRGYAVAKDNLIEAYRGLMYCNYELKKYPEAIVYADTLSVMPEITEALLLQSKYVKAKSLYETGKVNEAYDGFSQLAIQKEYAAEANYYIAESQYKSFKLKEAENTANKALKLSSGNEVLMLKTYLLLADILVQEKDYFNAKALLQSIVKNAKVEDYRKQASDRLDAIIAIENKQSKLKRD
jgi:tetratricopeptide (TPR) repeat protein